MGEISFLKRLGFWILPPVRTPDYEGASDYQYHGTSFEVLKKIVAGGGAMEKDKSFFTDEISYPRHYARASARKTGTPGFVLQFDNEKMTGKLRRGHYQPMTSLGRGRPMVVSRFVVANEDIPLSAMTDESKRNILSWMDEQRGRHPGDGSWPSLIADFKKALAAENFPFAAVKPASSGGRILGTLGRFLYQMIAGGAYSPQAYRSMAQRPAALPSEAELRDQGLDRGRLDALINDPRSDPSALIAELKTAPFLKEQYESPSGVVQGYSLERHTLMVLGQFEKYFQGPLPAGVDRGFFRLILALHDIGKPQAAAYGFDGKQHRFTQEIMKVYLGRLNFPPGDIDLALRLMAADPIGPYLRAGGSPTGAAAQIKAMHRGSSVPLSEFLDLLLVFYMADAGAYTKDAGGWNTLGRLFIFDHAGPSMRFAPKTAIKIEALKDEVARSEAAAGLFEKLGLREAILSGGGLALDAGGRIKPVEKPLEVRLYDHDNNVAYFRTPIYLRRKTTHEVIRVTTQRFAEERTSIGKSGEYEDYELFGTYGERGSYQDFRDLSDPEIFPKAAADAVDSTQAGMFRGPSWFSFAQALRDPRKAPWVGILTSRAHEAENMVKGYDVFKDRGLLARSPRKEMIFPVGNAAVSNVLQEPAGSREPQKKLKVLIAFLDLVESVPLIHPGDRHSLSFSDDDLD
ncbi:MAG: hypothetical protein ACHQ2Z_17090, partial [Elusimicrobiota bacterium]